LAPLGLPLGRKDSDIELWFPLRYLGRYPRPDCGGRVDAWSYSRQKAGGECVPAPAGLRGKSAFNADAADLSLKFSECDVSEFVD